MSPAKPAREVRCDPDLDPEWVGQLRRELGAWYDRGHRDLPWRADRDPYRILVSETMLVQTTVAAVVPYFERFLARFPTVQALAVADEAEVLKAWEGLGYYRRARQLHQAAQAIVRHHGGLVPEDPEALRALPGVGRYIAGAILSFAFDRPAPIVEANTQRVLARLLAWPHDLKTAASQTRLWQAAERLVDPERPGRFNQALMELGATLCAVRAPMCLACPVARHCQARAQGRQDALPISSAKAPPRGVVEACALVERAGRLLIVQRGPGRLWEGFWEFPTVHVAGADPAGRALGGDRPINLAEGVRRLTGVVATIGPAVKTLRFGVTNHRVTLTAYAATATGGTLAPGPGLVRVAWERPADLGRLVFGSAQRRLATWVSGATQGPPAEGRGR
ncbi:MAG: A/G-specific adenine glycosylase [Isosphaeraceae bacterium]|nr:A/G-specific adenine glycosylase [Isosphaeraceae bacterium]